MAQSLSLLDARVVEGHEGKSALVFEARLSAAAAGPVSFNFATSNGSTDASDFDALSKAGLVIPAGKTSLKLAVLVNGDTNGEADETLAATISNVSGAGLADGNALGLILNDDGTMLISAAHDPAAATTGSTGVADTQAAISPDGRFVVFLSSGSDLAAGQPSNALKDVFLRDLRTGLTTLVSVGTGGAAANNDSYNAVVSADGRYVAFESRATNLVATDGNGTQLDIFLRDLQAG
ncbi:MAG: TolB family protein, partial [Arenimonas sp.]